MYKETHCEEYIQTKIHTHREKVREIDRKLIDKKWGKGVCEKEREGERVSEKVTAREIET